MVKVVEVRVKFIKCLICVQNLKYIISFNSDKSPKSVSLLLKTENWLERLYKFPKVNILVIIDVHFVAKLFDSKDIVLFEAHCIKYMYLIEMENVHRRMR